jgi:hypothetical protein
MPPFLENTCRLLRVLCRPRPWIEPTDSVHKIRAFYPLAFFNGRGESLWSQTEVVPESRSKSCRPAHHQTRWVELSTIGTNSGWVVGWAAFAGAAGKAAISPAIPHSKLSLKSSAISASSVPLPMRARNSCATIKRVVLIDGCFLVVVSAAARQTAYTCAKPPSTNNSTPET